MRKNIFFDTAYAIKSRIGYGIHTKHFFVITKHLPDLFWLQTVCVEQKKTSKEEKDVLYNHFLL